MEQSFGGAYYSILNSGLAGCWQYFFSSFSGALECQKYLKTGGSSYDK